MAEAIKKEFDLQVELIAGAGGVFDVHVGDTRIWSKSASGRFPTHAEVTDGIAELISTG
ncbi:MAG: Rdx family protein [Phycisphaerales bacterium]|nr:MAG: Rdx family protein [Phycisphaerales bacterium]